MFGIDGLASGLNTSEIINQLMSLERRPQVLLQQRLTLSEKRTTAWNDISSKLAAVRTAALSLTNSTSLDATTATSSRADLASVTTTGSPSGSLTFRVLSLAAAGQGALSGFSSATHTVGAGTLTLGSGVSTLGITNVRAGADFTGTRSLSVSQASDGARITAGAFTPVTVTAGSNDTLNLAVDGVTVPTVTVAAGTYNTAEELAAAVNAALSGSGAKAEVRNGALSIKTAAEGSAHALDITGGTALASFNLAPGSAVGVDAIVTDGTESFALSDVRAGVTANLAFTGGSVSVTLGGHLSAGTSSVSAVRTTSSTATLNDLSAAVNAAGVSASATVLNTGTASGTQLLLTSKQTGAAHDVVADMSGFATNGTYQQLSSGADATLSVGSQTVVRSSNTITDLLDGVTVNLLKADSSADVTISTAQNVDGVADKVKTLVDALNAFVGARKAHARTDATGKEPGPLSGNSSLRQIERDISDSLALQSNDAQWRVLSQIGVTVNRDGTYKYDEAALKKALTEDAGAVGKVLSRAGAALDARMSFAGAASETRAGSYEVIISAAAERATVTGAAFSSVSTAETLTFQVGTATGSYTTSTGQSAQDVVNGLNETFRAQSLALTAELVGGQLQVSTTRHGSAATVSVTSDNGAGSTGLGGLSDSGVDVAGTINGVAATGRGTTLTSADTGASKGLALTVTAGTADVAAAGGALNLGQMNYTTGVAGALVSLVDRANGLNGLADAAKSSLGREGTRLREQIEQFDLRLQLREAALRKQFTALETALRQIQSNAPNFASLNTSIYTGGN